MDGIMNPGMSHLFLALDLRDLVYLQFVVESYDGLAVVSTVDRKEGVVRISFPQCAAGDVALLLQGLGREISLKELPDYAERGPSANPIPQEGETHA